MPTLLVGGGLIQQSWGHSGFLFFLHPCVSSLSILCPDPGLLGLKGCLCFVPRTFLCREFGVRVGISTDATIITEHRLSTHRQAGNLISTHMPQVPCWLYHWAGSLGVQGWHRGGLLARTAKRRGSQLCGMQNHSSGSWLFSE